MRLRFAAWTIFLGLFTNIAIGPTAQAQTVGTGERINTAFTKRFFDLVVRMKVLAGRYERRPRSISRRQLMSLLRELKAVTRSPDMLRMPRLLTSPLIDRFTAEIKAGAKIVSSPGLHVSEAAALEKAFKKKTDRDTLETFVQHKILVEGATATFDTDFSGVSYIFYILIDEKFRNRQNFEWAMKITGRYGAGCEAEYGASRAIPELCLPQIAQWGFANGGSYHLALEWAREKTYYVRKLRIRSPEIRVEAALEHTKLEYAHGTRLAARQVLNEVAELQDAPNLKPMLRRDLKDWLQRVSVIRISGGNRDAKTAPRFTAKALEKFFLEGDRDYVGVARHVDRINRGKASREAARVFDQVMNKQGIATQIANDCRVRNLKTVREIAVFYPYHSGLGGNNLRDFCRFLFDRNVRRKRQIALGVLKGVYEDHANFSIEPDFFKEFVLIIKAQDVLGYSLAGRVSRELYFRFLNTEYGKGQVHSVRNKLKATLAKTLLPIYLDAARDLVRGKRFDRASRMLNEFTRTAEARLSAEWRGGSQSIETINRELRPLLARSLRYWRVIQKSSKQASSKTTADAFRAAQLLQMSDVALAVQTGLRRSAVLSPKVGKLLGDYEQALWQAEHLKQISEPLTYPTKDGIRGATLSARRRVDELRPAFERAVPFYQQFADVKPRSIRSVQRALGARDAGIMLVPQRSGTALFVITRKRARFFALPAKESEITAIVTRLREGLNPENENARFDVAAAHALYRDVLAPASRSLRGVDHLYVVAKGALSALPLHTLLEKPGQDGNWVNAAWLGKRFAFTVLPSIANLRPAGSKRKRDRGAPGVRLLGFGDPDFSKTGPINGATRRMAVVRSTQFAGSSTKVASLPAIVPLPESRGELVAVAAAQGGSSSKLHFGREASEARVKRMSESGALANFNILYFATHGVLPGEIDGENEAGLLLTIPDQPNEVDDGLLSAVEISRLRLDADWVILSACNTAGADRPEGAALSGLAKAFFAAGARSLLVSHWPVVSDAAVELTTLLFGSWNGKGGSARAKALQKAMLQVLVEGKDGVKSHPAYWAPFVIVGQ